MKIKDILIKLVLLVLSVAITLSCFAGCKEKGETENTSSNSSVTADTDDDSLDDDSYDQDEDLDDDSLDDENFEEDDWLEDDYYDGEESDDWDDDTYEDEEDWYEDEDEEDYDEEEILVTGTVKNNSAPIIDTFHGFSSIIYQMYTYMPYKNKENEFTEAQAQEQFDRMQEAGITFIRSDYNTWMAWDSTAQAFDYDSEYMTAFYKEALELKKRGIDISVVTGWSHHALLDDSSSIPSRELYVEGDWDATLKNWKNWMNDSILAFRAHGLTNLNAFVLFTEPGKVNWNDESAANKTDPKEQKHDTAFRLDSYVKYLDCARELDGVLKNLNLRNQFEVIGPNLANDGNGSPNHEFMDYVLKNGAEYFDVITTHTYFKNSDPTSNVYYDLAENFISDWMGCMQANNSDKEFWIDEWNVGVWGYNLNHDNEYLGLQYGVCATAMMNYGVSNSILWSYYSQQWPNNTSTNGEYVDGVQVCGLLYTLQMSTIPTKQFYAYTLLSKYFNDKNTVCNIEYDDFYDVYISCATNDNGDMTIVVTNLNIEPAKFELDFEKTLGGRKLYRHTYNTGRIKADTETQVLPADRVYYPVEDRLVDQVPACSMVVYTTDKG